MTILESDQNSLGLRNSNQVGSTGAVGTLECDRHELSETFEQKHQRDQRAAGLRSTTRAATSAEIPAEERLVLAYS